nr:hypothetical protein [Streptomyces sp. SID4985]
MAVVGASGCSSDEATQEFAAPKSLCGVSVPSAALSRLLPADGARVSVQQDGTWEDGSFLCKVTVDKNVVLIVNQMWVTAGYSARHVLIHEMKIWDQQSADGGAVVYADRGGASVVKCQAAGVKKYDVGTLVKVLKPGRQDEKAMGQLMRGYTLSLKARNPCRSD